MFSWCPTQECLGKPSYKSQPAGAKTGHFAIFKISVWFMYLDTALLSHLSLGINQLHFISCSAIDFIIAFPSHFRCIFVVHCTPCMLRATRAAYNHGAMSGARTWSRLTIRPVSLGMSPTYWQCHKLANRRKSRNPAQKGEYCPRWLDRDLNTASI